MRVTAHQFEAPTAVHIDLGAIFVSLELSRSKWLITSLSPGRGEKMSKHMVVGSDVAAMLACFAELRRKAQARTGRSFPIIIIQEAGLDGFWIHRVLQTEGIESHVVDPASIAVSRRRRRAKTDKIDGEALVLALLAYKRGEPRVCKMVRAPTPEEEDLRRISRERKALSNERIRHVNRIKGLLFGQGKSGYEPLRRDQRKELEMLARVGIALQLLLHLKRQALHSVTHVPVGPSRSRPDIPPVPGSRPQRLQGRGDHRRGRVRADTDPDALQLHFDNAQVGAVRRRQCRRRSRRRFDDHRRKSAGARARRPPRLSAPFMDEARADILATRHLRDHRAGLRDRRQNRNPVFFAPSQTPFVARDQCHPTHAAQLASLIKPT